MSAARTGVVVVAGGVRDPAAALQSASGAALRVVVSAHRDLSPPPGVALVSLAEERGYAAGVNAGIRRVKESGRCDRVLLLNDDARLEAGALDALSAALDDPALAAVGPLVLRASDGRLESRGAAFDPRSGRFRLLGHGEGDPLPSGPPIDVPSLSGAAWMMSLAAFERVGPLDEAFFAYFEETEWCARARAAGLGLRIVPAAIVRHEGGATLGTASPDRLYYSARNHFRAAERALVLRPPASWLRAMSILGFNVAHAVRQRRVPRSAALRAVLAGLRDHCRGRYGRRMAA